MKFTAVSWGLGKLLGKRVNSIHTALNYSMGAVRILQVSKLSSGTKPCDYDLKQTVF